MTVLFLLEAYASTNSEPTSQISSSVTSSKGGYYQLLPQSCRSFLYVRLWDTLFWNIPIAQPTWGVIVHLSNPKRITTYTNTLKIYPHQHVYPFLSQYP